MYTLGINAVFHDSSATLVQDGRVIAAAEEERFTGIKHGKRPIPFSTYELPFHAIAYCLRSAGIRLADVAHVAYSFNPQLFTQADLTAEQITLPLNPAVQIAKNSWNSPWDPLFLSHVINAPKQLVDGAPHHLAHFFKGTNWNGPHRWHFLDHHLTHAASAFLASPFAEAAVLTLDGRGEKDTTTYHLGHGNGLEKLGEVAMPNSLGLLYEQVTTYLGFLHSSDEYKVMALASYGRPTYVDEFRRIVELQDHGQYRVHSPRLSERFGSERVRNSAFEQKHFDVAHSLQVVVEETVLHMAEWLKSRASTPAICLAGGVALNCVMNARLRDSKIFRQVWVQPAAGDAGTSLGAALWIDAQERSSKNHAELSHVYLGPEYSEREIEDFLLWAKVPYRRLQNVARQVSHLLAQDKVIGWFQGRMEFGPRALGARSILASPIHAAMQARLNEIKDREDFRPVAPVVLEEEAARWFKDAEQSPFMLFVNDVLSGQAEKIPAVRHTDGTARIQTLRREQNPLYYDLIRAFQERTGVPILVNTSFNTRGKPIVCSPRDAVECFWTSPLDALCIGPFLLEKNGVRS